MELRASLMPVPLVWLSQSWPTMRRGIDECGPLGPPDPVRSICGQSLRFVFRVPQRADFSYNGQIHQSLIEVKRVKFQPAQNFVIHWPPGRKF